MTTKSPIYSHAAVTISDVINYLEQNVHAANQNSEAVSGLVVGDIGNVVTGILIALDITEALLDEAIENRCNFIIVSQPFFRQPLTEITPENYAGACIIKAIKYKLTIYIFSTNLDHLGQGASRRISDLLELQEAYPIILEKEKIYRLTTFVLPDAAKYVIQALCEVGALFATHHLTSAPVNASPDGIRLNPLSYFSAQSRLESLEESQLTFIVPILYKEKIIQTLLRVHPYEKVTYYLEQVEIMASNVGRGLLGSLPIELPDKYFLKYIKTKLTLSYLQHTNYFDRPIKTVAVYAGNGSALLQEVLHKKVDAFITTGLQYEQFLEANGKILLIDIGHHATRLGLKKLIFALLSKEFNNIVILRCKTITNPIHHIND